MTILSGRMQIPLFLILITIVSLLSTCLFYDNHRRLITSKSPMQLLRTTYESSYTFLNEIPASGHKLPSFSHLLRSSRSYIHSSNLSPSIIVLSNPFTLAPIAFSIALVGGIMLLPVYVAIANSKDNLVLIYVLGPNKSLTICFWHFS